MAALDIRTADCLLGGSRLVMGAGGIVSVGICGSGRGRTVVSSTAVLGFGDGVAGMKVMGFCSPVVGGSVLVFGHGAIVGGIALARMVVICCRIV